MLNDVAVAPGSIVVVRDAEWLVTSVEPTRSGLLVRAQGLSELVRGTTASFYSLLDEIEPLDPAQARVTADDSPGYRRARLWLEATIRKTSLPLGGADLSVSPHMLVNSLGYQRTAVQRAFSRDLLRPRLLIADAVGLGKTIEIGMILSELVRRGRGERILIVTPKHVLEQMQHEMWTRFALPFVRLDSVGIQRVRQELPATRNPFSRFKRAIISIDTLKQDRYLQHLRDFSWDAVVIDESHNITGATLNNRLARVLAPQTEALILASATPHNGRKESFAELVRLLEPTAVSPSNDIDTDMLKKLVIRRHRYSPEVKAEVGSDWAERRPPNNVLVPATAAEDAIARELSQVWLHPVSGQSPYSGQNSSLFPWTLAKAFLSSIPAFRETVQERLKRLGSDAARSGERVALERLLELADAAAPESSAKFRALLDVAREVGISASASERLVVFSERVATLKWLQQALRTALKLRPEQVAVLHGGLSDVEQQEIVESFKLASSPIRILVTGDIASEGVNLHAQCHELVHYDIPWSLIRIEQRNGRIDRYGQKHPPRITTLLLNPSDEMFSGDVRVLTRLLERESEAHTALGDAASLMGHYDAEAEEKAIMSALARGADFDEVVPTVDSVAESSDPFAQMLALLATEESAVVESAEVPDLTLFDSAEQFLQQALAELSDTAEAPLERGGFGLQVHANHHLVSLAPPPDLAQRLRVLPQTYVQQQRVTERLALATTRTAAERSLAEARSRADRSSLWPESHYLGPLHPVLDWAADRALAKLARNEVFVLRTSVDTPTVVLVGTLTNRRGQVVGASYMTAPQLGPSNVMLQAHEDAREALDSVGMFGRLVNRGDLDPSRWQHLIPIAVEQARDRMHNFMVDARADLDDRVAQWVKRVRDWERDADALVQVASLRENSERVAAEESIAESMRPSQVLVRPLLLAVPEGE
ncbi:helicase-related protein [Salinibacterium sp. ZJ70]|uniref:helicase-related protein n=1 Tax=Salinibacterium sp. ZJ70 TaxID=2708084 RepID=UPI00142373AD|nr:helicase-related protein [Salinibacterium sp. ZJ70]